MSTGPAIRTSRSHSSSSSLDGGLAVILPGEVAVVVIVGVAAMSALLIRPHSIELRLLVTSADVRASPVNQQICFTQCCRAGSADFRVEAFAKSYYDPKRCRNFRKARDTFLKSQV